jgi:hypothetical protein
MVMDQKSSEAAQHLGQDLSTLYPLPSTLNPKPQTPKRAMRLGENSTWARISLRRPVAAERLAHLGGMRLSHAMVIFSGSGTSPSSSLSVLAMPSEPLETWWADTHTIVQRRSAFMNATM